VKYLLDTHAFLWWIGDDPSLSDKARKIIADSSNEIYLSSVSIWEIAIKSRTGRLEFSGDLESFVDQQILKNSFQPLPITLAHAARIKKLPNHHRDPFDQMLVAQGAVEGMPLISIDKKIKSYDIEVVW
jgi:PIN domain nuclease of toxin-antitoxin system